MIPMSRAMSSIRREQTKSHIRRRRSAIGSDVQRSRSTTSLAPFQSLLLLSFLFMMVEYGDGTCPEFCDCKWADGKETVVCVGARMMMIPQVLDPGTQVLDMSRNDLQTLPKNIFAAAGLLNLQRVYLVQCQIQSIAQTAFTNLTNLVYLDLSENKLTNVPSEVFPSIRNLNDLKLSKNMIQHLNSRAFQGLQQLIRLDLSENEITVINENSFEGLKALESLRLEYNSISRLAYQVIQFLHLVELRLHENPWTCDCGLLPLRKWMVSQRVPLTIPPTCKRPGPLWGKSWDDLELNDFACPPILRPLSEHFVAYKGANATLQCEALSTPRPEIIWEYRGKVLQNGSVVPLDLPSEAMSTIYEDAVTGRMPEEVRLLSTLVLEYSYGKDNAGNALEEVTDMHCVARNKAGLVYANVTLSWVQKPPPSPTYPSPLRSGLILLAVILGIGCLFVGCVMCRKRQMMKKDRRYEATPNTFRYDEEDKYKIDFQNSTKMSGNLDLFPNDFTQVQDIVDSSDPPDLREIERVTQAAVRSCLQELENTPEDPNKRIDVVETWLDDQQPIKNGNAGGHRVARDGTHASTSIAPTFEAVKVIVNDFRRRVDEDYLTPAEAPGRTRQSSTRSSTSSSSRAPLLVDYDGFTNSTHLCTLPRGSRNSPNLHSRLGGRMNSSSPRPPPRFREDSNVSDVVIMDSTNHFPTFIPSTFIRPSVMKDIPVVFEDLSVSPTLDHSGSSAATFNTLPMAPETGDIMQQFLEEYKSLQSELEDAKERYRVGKAQGRESGSDYSDDFEDRNSSLDDAEDVPLNLSRTKLNFNQRKFPRVLPPHTSRRFHGNSLDSHSPL